MSVFKIQQQKVETQAGVDNQPGMEEKVEELQQTSEENQTTEEKALPGSGTKHDGAAPKPEVTVMIDGPVSRVFTDALNKMLATESYMTMLPFEDAVKEDDDAILQVYAWKAEELNTEDVVQITNNISRHHKRDFVIAIEDVKVVTRQMGLLDNLSKLPNVTICYNRERAMSVVKQKVQQ